ncbi:hypothetical protein [Falsiroseomonas tokyonensis]|uniref:ASCH domain-containing protein n=1 Tax=Falsiroseomonas tokyonensis TaxID=430521 RepID=A0ABV7BX87_9PROT|nr:hypothetical protein [Falsiroseomonas tokyonensis]MBU8540237.1 hypothetical protein [Falsiroseomonas tokyonensis]
MTARPIIFSAPMVLALLAGRKTQTRRLASSPLRRVQLGERLWVRENWQFAPQQYCTCPQGAEPSPCDDWQEGTGCASNRDGTIYAADGVKAARWRPSIHMSRWASRLTLTVTDVRVQRLGAMSSADARAEGTPLDPYDEAWADEDPRRWVLAFAALWDRLHGAGAWDANPWVVALTFTVERRNVDA